MKRGIISRNKGTQSSNVKVEKNIEDGEGQNYLGILEAGRFQNLEMNGKVRKEYFCRIILMLKLNSDNANNGVGLRQKKN